MSERTIKPKTAAIGGLTVIGLGAIVYFTMAAVASSGLEENIESAEAALQGTEGVDVNAFAYDADSGEIDIDITLSPERLDEVLVSAGPLTAGAVGRSEESVRLHGTLDGGEGNLFMRQVFTLAGGRTYLLDVANWEGDLEVDGVAGAMAGPVEVGIDVMADLFGNVSVGVDADVESYTVGDDPGDAAMGGFRDLTFTAALEENSSGNLSVAGARYEVSRIEMAGMPTEHWHVQFEDVYGLMSVGHGRFLAADNASSMVRVDQTTLTLGGGEYTVGVEDVDLRGSLTSLGNGDAAVTGSFQASAIEVSRPQYFGEVMRFTPFDVGSEMTGQVAEDIADASAEGRELSPEEVENALQDGVSFSVDLNEIGLDGDGALSASGHFDLPGDAFQEPESLQGWGDQIAASVDARLDEGVVDQFVDFLVSVEMNRRARMGGNPADNDREAERDHFVADLNDAVRSTPGIAWNDDGEALTVAFAVEDGNVIADGEAVLELRSLFGGGAQPQLGQ